MDQNTNDFSQGQAQPVDDAQSTDFTQPDNSPQVPTEQPVEEFQPINEAEFPAAEPEPTESQPAEDAPTEEELKEIENMTNEEFIEAFANSLLDEKDLGEMDDDTRADMVQDLVERVTTFINRAVLSALPEDKVIAIDQIVDNNGTAEEINKIVQDSGIDVERISTEALTKFREIYLGDNEDAEV